MGQQHELVGGNIDRGVDFEERQKMRMMLSRMNRAFDQGIRDDGEGLVKLGQLVAVMVPDLERTVMLVSPQTWWHRHDLKIRKNSLNEKVCEIFVTNKADCKKNKYMLSIEPNRYDNQAKFVAARELGINRGLIPMMILSMDENGECRMGCQGQEEAIVLMLGCDGVRSGVNGSENKHFGAVALSLDPLDQGR
jgi:hypothetical protein